MKRGRSKKTAATTMSRLFEECAKQIRSGKLRNLSQILPALISFDNKPFSLNKGHWHMEPLFSVYRSKWTTLLCARQVGKTVSQAADMLVTAGLLPGIRQLYVTPLFEHVRRFSNNTVRPMLQGSPMRVLWTGTKADNSVLQKTFLNGSTMLFSFAYLDVTRVRGATADIIRIDEAQSIALEFVPVIKAVASASDWDVMIVSGTPLTLDTPIHGYWTQSSQAEWFIPCRHAGCHIWNIPSTDYHLDKMIGPMRDDISPNAPGLVCAKCRRPLFPEDGCWVHRKTSIEAQEEHAGYHVPQPVLSHHCNRPDRWKELLRHQQNYPRHQFVNEILGESLDSGQKVVTQSALLRAARLPWKNNPREPVSEVFQYLPHYPLRVLAIDWSGSGEKEVSYTTVALMGQRATGHLDVLWGKRFPIGTEHMREAAELKYWFDRFQCHTLVHDYTGAGNIRESVLIGAGMDPSRIKPVAYVRAAQQNFMTLQPPTLINSRAFYKLDKPRSLTLTANAIKVDYINFFAWDFVDAQNPGLLSDFLSLVEQKTPTRLAGDTWTITKNPLNVDDFAQAVNIGASVIWYETNTWPNLAAGTEKFDLDEQRLAAAGAGDFTFTNDPRDLQVIPELSDEEFEMLRMVA